MKYFGDITKLSGYELPIIDVITGGSPCQDLSVAGKRAGLDGERSGLFMEQIRLVKEMRERDRANGRTGWAVRPRYMVWENVPGAFSSNGGKDFQAVLTEIVRIAEPEAPDVPLPEKAKWTSSGCIYDELGGWSIAWRVHDAQFWGVPQRRKRISLVADFGGLSAPEILFERKGLSRDSEQSGTERERTSARTESGAGGTISFQERAGKPGGARESLSRTSEQEPCQPSETKAFCIQGGGRTSLTANGIKEEVSYTLNCMDEHGVAAVDVYNQTVTGQTAAALTAACGGTNTSGAKVLCAGFDGNAGYAARSAGYEEEAAITTKTSGGGHCLIQLERCVPETIKE